MNQKEEIQFCDKTVTYSQFVNDLASAVAMRMHQIEKGQLEISQAEAFRLFSRADVERWVKNGKIQPCRISPGKKRFKLDQLQKWANVQQTYLV